MTEKQVNRGAGYGLEILFMYTHTGLKKGVGWIQRKISEELKITNILQMKLSNTFPALSSN